MDILVFEYMTSGGWVGELPETILPEGLAMARTLSNDLARGNITVHLPLDDRLWNSKDLFAHCNVLKVSKKQRGENIYQFLTSELRSHDAALLIAPESDQILFTLTALAEKIVPVLGASSSAITRVTSKWETLSLAESSGISVPRTHIEQQNKDPVNWKIPGLLRSPLVVKPDDGCGADGCTLVRTRRLLNEALQYAFTFSKKVLIQEYITGTHVSTSFVASEDHVLVLTLNQQDITLSENPGQKSEYLGGLTPFEHPLCKELRDKTETLAGKISGMRGYAGVDFVLQGMQPFFMEINPRLTTSYVGISAIAKKNLGLMLIDSRLRGQTPATFETRGYARFGKVQVNNSITDASPIFEQQELVIPPIHVSSGRRSNAFVLCVGETPIKAQKKFKSIEQQLLNPSSN